MTRKTLLSIHCYSGDAVQLRILRDLYEHHKIPIVVISPKDAPVNSFPPHICRTAGEAGYTGGHTWLRQNLQMKVLLEYTEFTHFLLHDSDSVCLNPVLPDYLYEDDNVFYSNLVDDFRRPGETSNGHTWPLSYHAGYSLKASQPPYFCSRKVLEKIVAVDPTCNDDITPFIDWALVKWCEDAGVRMLPFRNCASCETKTTNGLTVMSNCVRNGAEFVHAIKTRIAKDVVVKIYKQRNKIK